MNAALELVFQFHNGAIKRFYVSLGGVTGVEFQFHNGAIKRTL